METEEPYMEEEIIVLPNIEDGPTTIGDLWDCRKSELIGLNLFRKKLTSQFLEANYIKELKYTLTDVRSIKDHLKPLQLSSEVTLELLSGFIKVDGRQEHKSMAQSSTSAELLCHYDLKTFSVNALPTTAAIINELVVDKIVKGEINATHVVMKTILGADVMAYIRLSETDSVRNIFEKLVFGQISATAKIALEKLDKSKAEDFEKKIKMVSKPFFSLQPETFSEMFQLIEGIGQKFENVNPLAVLEVKDYLFSEVFGVPLQFYLVPMKNFVNIRVERLYVKIKSDILDMIVNTLETVIDLQRQGCLMKRITKKEPRLKQIFLDQNNSLVLKIIQREKEIRAMAKQHYLTYAEFLKKYKVGQSDQQYLLKLAHEVDKEISMTVIYQEILEFISEGQREFLQTHDGDVADNHQLSIFTNTTKMMQWYHAQNEIKVLLRTGGNYAMNEQVTCLYNISDILKDMGVEVGIAVPAISEGRHDLTIKIDDMDETYSAEELSFVLKILLFLVHQADQISARLFTIYAALNGIKLPLQNHLTELHNIINILGDVKQVRIADSYLKLRDFALVSDGRWKFVIDLNAIDSASESIAKFRYLNIQLSGDWIVGHFGFESLSDYSNSPLLFIFKDEQLEAVCFDNVDIVLLIEALKPNADHFLKLLHPDQLKIEKSCLHVARANFAWKVLQLFKKEQNPTISLQTESFSTACNRKIETMQLIVRSIVTNDDISLWRAMANIMMHELPDVTTILKSFKWIEDGNIYHDNPLQLASTLKEFLNERDPFNAKLQLVLESVSISKKESESVNECISNFFSDVSCPQQLKEQLASCQEIQDDSIRFEKMEKILKRYLETTEKSRYETVILFIKLLEIRPNSLDSFLGTELLPKLVEQLDVDESKYPSLHGKLLKLVEARNYYAVLHVLAQMQYVENHVFLVHSQLEALSTTTDTKTLCQLLGNPTVDKLRIDHYQWLFANPKFVHLLEINSSCSQLLKTLKFFHCKKSEIPEYIPDFLRGSLQAMLQEDSVVECPDMIHNIDEAIAIFQRIASQNRVPENFGRVLSDSVRKNMELKIALKKANALFYWKEELQLFEEIWTSDSVRDAYNRLTEWKLSLDHKPTDDRNTIKFEMDITSEPRRATDQQSLDELNELAGSSRTQAWQTLLGLYSETISPRKYFEIQNIQAEPCMGSVFEEGFVAKLLPYIFQRLKMWGVHVIQQENLAKLTTSQAAVPNGRYFKKFVFDENSSQSSTSMTELTPLNTSFLISRIDILTCLNAVSNGVVFHELLRIMSQFPVALPLILLDVHGSQWDYVCLVSLLKGISVKWELRPGVVVHNHLFINPFKMIVAFRVGSAPLGSSGKSTILNQILGTKHMFSSLGGPGADKGVPLTLHGSVELTVLLQETCSYALWESVVKNHYASGSNEVLLLVNIHGNALQLPQTMELLKTMATSFIAFFMPCTCLELQTGSMKIQNMLDDTDNIVYILVDPTSDCEGQPTHRINTTQLTLDNTLETIRFVLGTAIQMGVSKPLLPLSNISNRIRPSPNIFTEESKVLLTSIKNMGCKKARSTLQLQKLNPKYVNAYSKVVVTIWENEATLQTLIKQFVHILNLPLKFRLLALAHLDRELSLLTANESIKIREKLGKFQEQRRRLMNLEGGYSISPEQEKIIEQIRFTMDELDGMSLGIEHLYRELGRIYQASQCNNVSENNSILSLPRKYAELLISGHAIEILDGDIGDICGPWLDSICHSVCEFYPGLRVFTLSIIGLQSSGKSTLLNALFACKFAVSVGRCTRGLFMRLIFLEKSFSDELNTDAILLIDTEGLGAPEKLNDPHAEHKDRLLATFAMTVSNLTLINVLGESVRDLTDILQIVIVTMARLEKADISPDILMIQHLSERDSSKTMKGVDEFCKALEEAVCLTDSKDMAIGVRNCKSLRNLEYRVRNGQLLKQFRSFKNGASANAPPSQEYHDDIVDLYKTIMNTCRQVTRPQNFHTWHELIQNYWSAVSSQDFSLRFKNIQEVHEFIDRGSAIAKVKEALDAAFRIHKESCETNLRQKVNELANNAQGIQNWETEKENALQIIKEALKWIPHSCHPPCFKCSEAIQLKNQLFMNLEGKNCQQETEITINTYIQKTRESVIKHLSQMVEALRVKHGWSCEFDSIIGRILMEKLEDEPNPTENERLKMLNEVWSQLVWQISQKVTVVPANRRIFNQIREEYDYVTTLPKNFKEVLLNKKYPDLANSKAIDYGVLGNMWGKVKGTVYSGVKQDVLDFKLIRLLKSELNNLPYVMLEKCGVDHFEDGMVRKLKQNIDMVLHKFETDHIPYGKLLPKFKWKVHVYALLTFTNVMTTKDDEWNKNNNPYFILIQNEDTYKEKIRIRLQHGFGYEAEGKIIGDLLLKTIRKRAQKQGDRTYIDSVRSMSWLTSSENVRLNYFSKLAKEVEAGDKKEAVKHFNNPKYKIEVWFKKEVDSHSAEIGIEKFNETATSELDYVIQEIQNQKNCRGIKVFIDKFFTQVEDMEYNPVVDLESDSATDFDMLKTFILRKLDDDKLSLKCGITMNKPSTHPEIRCLMGCTENCPWCGSLCWGQAGHGENTDDTKKHHACHQPEGLIGVHDVYKRYLISNSCDNQADNVRVLWHNCKEGMTWLQAKSHDDFVNWIFTPHHKSEFNELMKWFFIELHKDIAKSRNLQPAREKDLSTYGFFEIVSVDHILASIKSRI